MKTLATLSAISLCLAQPGSRRILDSQWGSPGTRQLVMKFYSLAQKGDLEAALSGAQAALKSAVDHHEDRSVLRILTGIASLENGLGRYNDALRHQQESQQLAAQSGDIEQMAIASAALSAIYLQLYDLDHAVQSAELARRTLFAITNVATRAQVLMQLGRLASLRGRYKRAVALFADGIREAAAAGETATVATGYHRMGAEMLAAGHFEDAERALDEAYRQRLLSHDQALFTTRYELAKLKLAQGDLRSAAHLAESALQSATGNRIPRYHLIYLRGRIRQAQGDLAGALQDLREARVLASRWRGQILPAESFRTGTDAGLDEVYDTFIEAAVTQAIRTRSQTLIEEAWRSAEVNRAASLREMTLDDPQWRAKLPPAYWERLAGLRALEARVISSGSPSDQSELERLRLELTELEIQNGLSHSSDIKFTENNPSEIPLSLLRRVIGQSRMLVSFNLGERVSYRWDTSSSGLTVTALPPEGPLNQLADDFRHAVESDDPARVSLGLRLYSILFVGITSAPNQTWLLALDGRLFEIPFAALVTSVESGAPRYLVEDRAVEVVPGAWAVGAGLPFKSGPFLAVGDPIYNRADSRYQGDQCLAVRPLTAVLSKFWNWSRSTAELPRLIGSAGETSACARLWPSGSEILTGPDATRERLESALAHDPAVVHIATHYVRSRSNGRQMMVALSLRPATLFHEPLLELLTTTEVSALNVPGSIVALSGCSSAAGQTLPGAGHLGLTRSWIAAGASHVVASHWPTPDDSGELFSHFYKYLRERQPPAAASVAVAEALRRAQLDMLHSGSWRASPRYWSAFQLTGRSNSKQ